MEVWQAGILRITADISSTLCCHMMDLPIYIQVILFSGPLPSIVLLYHGHYLVV